MKKQNKLQLIEAKIEELQKIQKQLEEEFISDLSNQIAKLLIKKKLFNLEKSEILNRIEKTLDEISNQK